MLFNTPVFLVFLAIVFPVAYFAGTRSKKGFLLAASYVFYGYWDWRFCGLLLASTLIDFAIGRRLGRTDDERARKRLLVVSLCTNLGILGVFKYLNFFVDSFQSAFGGLGYDLDYLHIHVILPVGISFYTFQTLSYTFDVYRRRMQPTHSLLDFALFVSFFPQLVAGPIERAHQLLPQIARCPRPSRSQIETGLALITVGMFRKVLIGDSAGKFVDHIFAEPVEYASFELLTAILLFSIQIYADFSGYSLIARGVGRLLGIELIENFSQPFLSRNITEFWRRWHISLSQWLRDYLYIWALGGNRRGRRRTYANLMITMLLGGLWHGAAWTFVIWGGLHGLALAFHRYFLRDRRIEDRFVYRDPLQLAGHVAMVLLTFVFVVAAFFVFRCPDFATATLIGGRLVDWTPSDLTSEFAVVALSFLAMTLLLDVIEYATKRQEFLVLLPPAWRYGVVASSWLYAVLYITKEFGRPMPFIYFQF